jgi:hypothetical protein
MLVIAISEFIFVHAATVAVFGICKNYSFVSSLSFLLMVPFRFPYASGFAWEFLAAIAFLPEENIYLMSIDRGKPTHQGL